VACPFGAGYQLTFIAMTAKQRSRFGSNGLPLVGMIDASGSQMSVTVFRSGWDVCDNGPVLPPDLVVLVAVMTGFRSACARRVFAFCSGFRSQAVVVFGARVVAPPHGRLRSSVCGVRSSWVFAFWRLFDTSTHELEIGFKSLLLRRCGSCMRFRL